MAQVDRSADRTERERPWALDQGGFLHGGAHTLSQRVGDGVVLDA